MGGRVRIGTCSGPADAVFVRSMFAARGIAIVVGAEHHASLLGPLGGSFLSLDIWVDEDDGEEAAALLRDLRESKEGDQTGDDNDNDNDNDNGDLDCDDDDAGDSTAPDTAPDAFGRSLQLRLDERRRVAGALLLGCFVTFGTAHMFTRAWMRGIALAALEAVGIMHVMDGHAIGGVVIAAAVIVDLIGALWRVRAAPKPTLPMARVHSG